MIAYPIYIPKHADEGRNVVSARIVAYLNDQMQFENTARVFEYHTIAEALSLPIIQVEIVLNDIGAGTNGITIWPREAI